VPRQFNDWIAEFVSYSSGIRSPEIFRAWSAMSCIAAALERKCYVHLSDHDVFPNLYVLLVGPPAAGKSLACNEGRKVARRVNGVKLGPQDVTEASLYDRLQASTGHVAREGMAPLLHHSLTVQVPEMGTLLKSGDINFCNALTSLYDCEESFEKGRRTTEDNVIQNSFLNLIICGTPSNVSEVFTPKILEQGLPSRFVMVFSEKPKDLPPLLRSKEESATRKGHRSDLAKELASDLGLIHKLNGEFIFSPEAGSEFIAWYDKGLTPTIEDSKFVYYNDRRHLHLAKLMMCISASRRDSMIILPEDFHTAKAMLLAAEKDMPKALEYSGANSYYPEMVKIVRFIAAEHARIGGLVPEWKIRKRMARDIPVNLVEQIIANLILSKEVGISGEPPNRGFKPTHPLH